MNKSCCVGDADLCPTSSSCTMILRSACSHKRCHKSSTVTEVSGRRRTHRQSKHVTRDSQEISDVDTLSDTRLGSLLESSLKQLALKSAKSYTILKRSLHSSLELLENQNHKVYNTDLFNSSCSKQLHFSGLSVSSNSYLNESSMNRKECSDYSSGWESDTNTNFSDFYTSDMSRTRKLNRSSIASVRGLSGSESEDENSVRKVSGVYVNRNAVSGIGCNSNITGKQKLSQSINNNQIHSTLQNSSADTSSLLNDHSEKSSEETSFSRVRSSVWKFIYLQIIRLIDLDVWFLSRLRQWGKYKAILLFLLLPLLFLLLCKTDSESLHVISSSLSSFLSYSFSMFGSYFVEEEELVVDVTTDDSSCFSISSGVAAIFSSLSVIPNLISDLFVVTEKESASSYTDEHISQSSETYQLRKEELKILLTEILKEEKTVEEKYQNQLIKGLQSEFQSLTKIVAAVRTDMAKDMAKRDMSQSVTSFTAEYNKSVELLYSKLKNIEKKLEILKKCCEHQSGFLASLEDHLVLALSNIIRDESADSRYHFFHDWLKSKFVEHQQLSNKMSAALAKLKSDQQSEVNYDSTKVLVETIVKKYVESLKANLRHSESSINLNENGFSVEQMKNIVKEALLLYDADKTGLTDYALESGGGSVLGTRCSETYVEKNGRFSIFGLPLWSKQNSPRTAIQPDVHPGHCWAFRGSQGFLVVELSSTIFPTGFSLEHIPLSLSPTGSIDSAPKDFSVWGLVSENDNKGKLLGEYSYDINGDPLQYFAVQHPSEVPFTYVELKILSNHGNMEYTCLYRFRVHGTRAQ